MPERYLTLPVSPDAEAFLRCLKRQGTPQRVHVFELMIDPEVQNALCDRFRLLDGLDSADPYYTEKRTIRLQRFLGYDYVRQGIERLEMPFHRQSVADTAALGRTDGRSFVDESRGPITTWEEFERYPWPDPHAASARALEWYQENLPDDMCIVGSGGFGHFAEHLIWLMGYQTLCYALYDKRDLVRAIADRLLEINEVLSRRMLEYPRVWLTLSADDMGFKTGTLVKPDDLREFVLPGHRRMAEMAHAAGRLYALHSCGQLRAIMPDLIEDVGIDAKHSFEDTIEDIRDAKQTYGERIAVLGGVDMDFLYRADEQALRARVREVVDACQPGGGFCLGSGNSIANYIPLENYLIMLDEGRRLARTVA